jgi:glycosyltransferase involved in cell wall biosynthesis
LAAPSLADHCAHLDSASYTVADGAGGAPTIDMADTLDWMHRSRRRWDLVLVDVSQPLPAPETIVELQHAAYEYHHDQEIGFVAPGYAAPDVVAAGYQVDRDRGVILPSTAGAHDYGQVGIARYVLVAAAHGFYASSAAIDRLDIPRRHLLGLDLNRQVMTIVRHGWGANFRTLCFSTTLFRVHELPKLLLDEEQRRWLMERAVSASGGEHRIIFVLNATSVSGGIRAVFEIANGLAGRGFDVQIWSLEGTPTWFDLRVPVTRYGNYDDLLLSLRNEDAIKVATWWETAEVVWLASANNGLPVFLIQEFETWFYPDDPVAQAAVAASYRREFFSLTEASYQQRELAEIGVHAALIPHGYDSAVFRPIDGWTRDDNTMLALGRSFFQKNFAMTERAWRRLGDQRPTLLLFGTEPGILHDARVDYRERPRDEQVNELYNTATLFVQTSRHEGFSLPLLEAMAAGCPVITTDSHGNRDFCRDGENCVIVGQDDDAELAAVIRRLLDDPAERARLAAGGLATARTHTWPVVLDRVAAFYDSLAATHSPGEPAAEAAVQGARG